jgi:predicted HicB family RNase H-like nuclease
MNHPAAKTYLPLVRWSEEDQRYVGSCPPVIGDCCHGADPARVMRDLLVIVDEHLALMDADGIPYPPATNRPYSGKVPLRITPDLHRAIAARAAQAGESVNRYIELALLGAAGKHHR